MGKTWKIRNNFKVKYTNMIETHNTGTMIRFLPCIDFWYSGDENGSTKCLAFSFIGWEIAFWWGEVKYI